MDRPPIRWEFSPMTTRAPESATTLLTGVVDYAGLFPPAALPMAAAVAEYARARGSEGAWMLGRFVLPAPRLAEFGAALATVEPPLTPWRLSALAGDRADADVATVTAFNASSLAAAAIVDAVESRPADLDGVDWLAERWRGVDVYVEVSPAADVVTWLERIAARGLRAKIRTGGVTADAFPSPAAVVAFLDAAVHVGVAFKATAGLHHAVRGSYRLTYAADAAAAPMYGYLNVLLATAALRAGLGRATAEDLLVRDDASTLAFTDAAVRWHDVEFPTALLSATRASHLVGFGSCSFREPADEIQPLLAARS
jgi:hypothetical protein